MKRFFSSSQKRFLYLSANGRCEKCGELLGERWDAHHKQQYANGGVTELRNGAALCERCHILLHRAVMTMVKPRRWQRAFLDLFIEHRGSSFLLNVTPAAGKTIGCALACKYMLDRGKADFIICVVPTTAIKGDAAAGFLGDFHKVGIELTPVLKEGRGAPKEFQGGIVTYSQLLNLVSTLEVWASQGLRIVVVFDEIHHVAEDAQWGAASERLAACSVKIVGMTGTLFRGDGKRISFVSYDDEGVAVADYSYNYRDGVRDKVCRPADFRTDDGIAEFVRSEEHEREQKRISEARSEEDARAVTNTIFRRDADWLRTFIERADHELDEYRITDPDAGGLLVCRAGFDDALEERYLKQMARLLREVTGEMPEIISHDDKEANDKIERFRNSRQKWICAVRKISEGVDIKRLRVEVMAMRPTTELLFRQLVGRVLRVQNSAADPRERSTVFVAKFPQLQEWAKRLSDEAVAGIKDHDKEPSQSKDKSEGWSFTALASSHEDSGAVSEYGDEFTAAEINAAERERLNDAQLSSVPIVVLAHMRRKYGIESDPLEAPDEPLQVQKKKERARVNNLVRRLAISRNPNDPDFASIWLDIFKLTGAKSLDDLTDNFNLTVMQQAERALQNWLAGKNAAA